MDPTQMRDLPKTDLLLSHPALTGSGLPGEVLRAAAQAELEVLRAGSGPIPGEDALAQAVLCRAVKSMAPGPARVVNATGAVLHPGLGRAPLPSAAREAMSDGGYCALGYDLDTGRCGERGAGAEALLRDLTGAQAALVVNNNAAALLLALSALARDKGVALSRGELVELDGALRLSDLVDESGAELVEVGATNRTCQADYRAALESGKAQLLLKVHTSTYKMVGDTQEAALAELVGLGRAYGLPVLCDLGSGPLLPAPQLGLPEGVPSVVESVRAGADLVCFSGDKLLGGPQAGILVGRSWAVDALRRHPLTRALRPGRDTLAALEATLRLYQDPGEAQRAVPALAMLTATREDLTERAEALATDLRAVCGKACAVAVEPGVSRESALPGVDLPTALVTLSPAGMAPEPLARALRSAPVPVVAFLHHDRVALDVRTLLPGDGEAIRDALKAAL